MIHLSALVHGLMVFWKHNLDESVAHIYYGYAVQE
jgi:hypothetical protein